MNVPGMYNKLLEGTERGGSFGKDKHIDDWCRQNG